MDPILHLILTGGEPYLRKDLDKITQVFYENTQTPIITIPSNGWYTSKMKETLSSIMENCKDLILNQQISIDGIGDDHNKIRMDKQVKSGKNSFEIALDTISMIKELQKNIKELI